MTISFLNNRVLFHLPRYLSGTSAWTTHVPFAFWCVENLRPSLIVELGVHKGDSFFAFCQAVKTLRISTQCFGVDTWIGDAHAGFYDSTIYEKVQDINKTYFSSFSKLMQSTFDEAISTFEDGTIDLLHIDGRHHYEDVRHDFETWLPKLSRRGIVLFHDTMAKEREFEVWKFWDEISTRYPSFNFHHGYGLGVLGVGDELPQAWAKLWNARDAESTSIRGLFEFVGERIREMEQLGDCLGKSEAEIQLLSKFLERMTTSFIAVTDTQVELQHTQAALHVSREESNRKDDALQAIREESNQKDDALQAIREEPNRKDAALQAARDELRRQNQLIQAYEAERNTFGGQLGRWLTRKSIQWLPPGSFRRRLASLAVRGLRKWRRDGFAAFLSAAVRKIRRRPIFWNREHGTNTELWSRFHAGSLTGQGVWIRIVRRARRIAAPTIRTVLSRVYRRKAAIAHRIQDSGLFDGQFYRSSYSDMTFSFWPPALHYVHAGWRERRNPHPLFQTSYYLERYSDVAAAGINPLAHYLAQGVKEGRDPNPLFDTSYYLERYPDVAVAGINPLAHYLAHGVKEGRDPNPLFDTSYYLERYPEVEARGLNPLLDFMVDGWSRRRNPHPLFDTRFYLKQVPAVSASSLNPLTHYTRLGARQGLNPHPDFDCKFYLQTYAVPETQTPLEHYLTIGRDAGYFMRPPELQIYNGKPPKVSVVAPLYCKEKEVERFLHHFFSQSYLGEIEIVIIDDGSPDGSRQAVERFLQRATTDQYPKPPTVRILAYLENQGNCIARNRGIATATGELIFVIDADCMVNRDFVRAHAAAFGYGDCDVTVGPMNIEAPLAAVDSVVEKYDANPAQSMLDQDMQDPVNLNSFLNCVTRNFCVRKSLLETVDWFDPLFSYSASPESGYGWEDIEFGYRLYLRGSHIRFVPNAISVHGSVSEGNPETIKPLRSAKNYRRLFEKHPELLATARDWAVTTHERIVAWLQSTGAASNEDTAFLANLFREFTPNPFHVRRPKRELRVLTFRWHGAHQYELYKLPHEFTLLKGTGTVMAEGWEYQRRPLRPNARMVQKENVRFSDYDLALVHFDENVLAPENCNNVIGKDWGHTFQFFMDKIPIPKVGICHGTPQFYGQYSRHYRGADLLRVIEEERLRLVEKTKDILVIVNSYQAQREWGFRQSRVVWHGFDPAEFPPCTYEKGLLTIMKGHLFYRPHYNGARLVTQVEALLGSGRGADHVNVIEPPHPERRSINDYALAKFQNYVDWLRAYSVYFNPTLRSPMPRTRGESFMCGLAVVTANNHDADMFIRNGVNGFYGDSAEELADYLKFLLGNPAACRRIGEQGRKTAARIFNIDRFLFEWQGILENLAR